MVLNSMVLMETHSDTLSLKVHLQWTHTLCEVDILEGYGWRSSFPLLENTTSDMTQGSQAPNYDFFFCG